MLHGADGAASRGLLQRIVSRQTGEEALLFWGDRPAPHAVRLAAERSSGLNLSLLLGLSLSIYLLFPGTFHGVDGTLLELLGPFVLHELAEEADKLVDTPLGPAAASEPENQGVIVVTGRPRVDGPLGAGGAGGTGTGTRGCD